ncbi:MAG: ABC transporter ATP-binding protein [Chloroflexi bacterium]|nr:ABC transporter ATP-binding protein [Chloroflexota bacterium]MCL5108509.1 ABC transporter ATP-binding protein [Chloroflexota bacterium]
MISITDVVKTYTMGTVEVQALRGVSLFIDQGELVSIMGPSGSGKSTLMNILGCLDQPTSGSYCLEGVEVSQMTEDELAEVRNKRIGFVFQSFNLLPRLSAIEQVELPLIYAGEHNRRERSLEALALVGLADRAHHKPSELSGGQQQRVAIARALINSPAIILADEPTGNLDTHSSEEIMAIFQMLNIEQGITIIFVTHEPDIAQHTRRVVHLRDGRITSDEAVAEPRLATGVLNSLPAANGWSKTAPAAEEKAPEAGETAPRQDRKSLPA